MDADVVVEFVDSLGVFLDFGLEGFDLRLMR